MERDHTYAPDPKPHSGKADSGKDLDFVVPTPGPFTPATRETKGGEGPIYAPYIVINHDDPIVPSGVFYLSPDIWVQSSLGVNLPVEGEANTIFATVHNRGLMDAVNVIVRFFWADPSAAITDASIVPIGGNLTAATVAGVYIPAAASPGADSAVTVQCPVPWFPAHITHECLVVKAWSPGFDPNTPPFEPVLDPANDRHSAQHNVTVKLVAAGQKVALSIGVANFSGFAQAALVQVRSLSFRQVAGRLKAMGVPLRDGLMEPYRGLAIEASLTGERRFLRQSHAAFARMLMAEDAKSASNGSGREGRETLVVELAEKLEPWEQRQVSVVGVVPASARAGEAFGLDVSEYLGGIKTGGYVALFVVGG